MESSALSRGCRSLSILSYRYQGDQVLVIDPFLPVRQVDEAGIYVVQLGTAEFDAQFAVAQGKSVAAGVFAQDDGVGGDAHRLRSHDLVAERITKHTMLVDPSLMCESIAADDRLIGLHLYANDL